MTNQAHRSDKQRDNTQHEHQGNGTGEPLGPSQLFLVRVWAEQGMEGSPEWRGRVQHVTRGDAQEFSDWGTLIDLFVTMVPALESK
ncbi:MAG TPA: hypothetical protein VFH60_08315 [Chloroflexia bacterium]|nr:hypothetical protein [Chloroflexia bacterium]